MPQYNNQFTSYYVKTDRLQLAFKEPFNNQQDAMLVELEDLEQSDYQVIDSINHLLNFLKQQGFIANRVGPAIHNIAFYEPEVKHFPTYYHVVDSEQHKPDGNAQNFTQLLIQEGYCEITFAENVSDSFKQSLSRALEQEYKLSESPRAFTTSSHQSTMTWKRGL